MPSVKNLSTPPHVPLQPSTMDVTPVGDHDKKPKVQLCLEMRRKEVPSVRKSQNSKKVEQIVLEVTVMWVKHIPQLLGRRPNPFVKLRLLPEDDMKTTELHMEKNDAQYIEIFTFTLKSQDLTVYRTLEVQVCDNKATRNAKQFGSVSVPLINLTLGKPVINWYHLEITPPPEVKDTGISIAIPRRKNKKTKIPRDQEDQEDEDEEFKENLESLDISKSKKKARE